jgi:uncharacterized small protein (DUF1192 family)
VVVSALAKYLGCVEELPQSQKIVELEKRMAVLEDKMKRLMSETNTRGKDYDI